MEEADDYKLQLEPHPGTLKNDSALVTRAKATTKDTLIPSGCNALKEGLEQIKYKAMSSRSRGKKGSQDPLIECQLNEPDDQLRLEALPAYGVAPTLQERCGQSAACCCATTTLFEPCRFLGGV